MIAKLKDAETKYQQIETMLSSSDILANPDEYKRLMKEYKHLTPVIDAYRRYLSVQEEIAGTELMLSEPLDAEFRAEAEAELRQLRVAMDALELELKTLLLPRDPADDKNVVVEIRGGAGGEEAALFAAVLYRMYRMYAEKTGFRIEPIYANETGLGGMKEVSFMVEGDGAYSKLKFESGVHRVQRVPETEASGRIHTSTVTVAVLPEAEDVEVEINPTDLKIETCKSSGAGGQHINKTESAIRLLHIPTGIVIECQDERSQHKNRDKAMKLLRARLYDMKQAEQHEKIASDRRSQVGTGDRSERIRTYNYPQGRVTDHRIGLTLYNLENILNGDLEQLVEALITADTAARLKSDDF